MLKITTSILLVVLLITFTFGLEKWVKSEGVANLDCLLTDDPDDPIVLPYPGDCSKFIKCSYGMGYALHCPLGLHFSVEYRRCESQNVAKCNSNGVVNPPTIGGGSCKFEFKAHPTDCHKAIQCVNGIEYEVQCPEGSAWDTVNNKCSYTIQCA